MITAEEYAKLNGKAVAQVDADIAAGAVVAQRVGWQVFVAEPEPERRAKGVRQRKK